MDDWQQSKIKNNRQATNRAELAVRFGRKAKGVMEQQEYQDIFQTRLKEDSKAAGKWETDQGENIMPWCWWINHGPWSGFTSIVLTTSRTQ